MGDGPHACYLLGESVLPWEEAKEYCRGFHEGTIWHPTSASETAEVFSRFKEIRVERGKNTLFDRSLFPRGVQSTRGLIKRRFGVSNSLLYPSQNNLP